ncbi:hypothetical protein PVAP13_8NG035201 [Panicum virgatum]|uniref:Uncharacterized protein n=1 Tax=Panicum virgatum TaxID=38727 RepID=A0A8T0P558_PANVG|nr:hypothetical protein PVAP13_8NG035201 [Panicum virgatum]
MDLEGGTTTAHWEVGASTSVMMQGDDYEELDHSLAPSAARCRSLLPRAAPLGSAHRALCCSGRAGAAPQASEPVAPRHRGGRSRRHHRYPRQARARPARWPLLRDGALDQLQPSGGLAPDEHPRRGDLHPQPPELGSRTVDASHACIAASLPAHPAARARRRRPPPPRELRAAARGAGKRLVPPGPAGGGGAVRAPAVG